MTRFSKLILDANGKPVETNIREITQADIMRCPFRIMLAEHYRNDNSCRCNDITHTQMMDWGYRWSNGRWT